MARSVNKVILLGNLGADPELQTLPSGVPLCKFSVATSEKYKDKNGEWQEKTEWHNVIVWNKSAEYAGKYLQKGSKVYIEGKIQYHTYEKEGVTRYMTDINAFSIVLLDPKPSSENAPNYVKDSGKPDYQTETDDDIPF